MQHNRVTVLSSSETCHLGSSSNNPDMDANNATVDEQILLPNTLENDNFPRYLLNSHEMGMSRGNLDQQRTSLSLWESAGSSSMGCLADRGNFYQSKREHFAPSLSIGGPLSIDRRRHEGTSSLPSHNLNIDLNINQSDQFGAEDVDVVHSAGQSRSNTILANRGSTIAERIPRHEFSLDAIGSSSRTADPFDGAAGQEGGVLDSHRVTFKRKSVDGSHAESSAVGSSRIRHQDNNIVLPSSSARESTSLTVPTAANYAVSYPPMEQLNQSTTVATSSSLSDHYSLYNDSPEHGFVRNTRMRLSPNDYDQSLPSLLPEDSFRRSAYQPTPQSSSFIPVQPRQISSSASTHGRPHLSAVTQFSQNLHRASSNGNFGSRIGGSSSSADITIHTTSSHEPSRSLLRSDLPEPLLLGSLYSADSTNFPSATGSRGNQQNSIISSSSTARASVGTQQAPGSDSSQPSGTLRGSADTARRSLISAPVRSSSIALHHRGSSSTSHEIRSHQPGSSSRAPPQHYYRGGPPSADRQNSTYLDLQSFMQTIAASRDGSRTVSELRNVVDQIRQGRNARLEDLLLVDRSIIMRRANLIDRHRDMRLDVDNMSYEELLALGERIGHVSTGLCEEKIMTSLRQRKYVCLELEEPSTVVEPCCICQEEYVEGEDVGRLDCGHDFHTACIKQWLVIKNVCPVCKKTALDI